MMTTQTGGKMGRLLRIGLLAATLTCTAQAKADSHLQAQQYMEILGQIITMLEGHYVDSIDWAKAMDAGINGMLYELDPYTEFYSEEDQESWRTMTTGEYGGIGAVIQQHGDTVVISNPYVGMPAAEAGLRPGDQILKIDGQDMTGKTTSDVSERLRGEPGTSFVLTYRRPYAAEGPQELTITRRKVATPAVAYYGMLNDTTAYIQLDQFTDKAAKEVQDALRALRGDGMATAKHRLAGLVLDLRGNPGGLLDEAVKIVGMFVPKGSTVVETKAKLAQWNSTYRTNSQPIEPELRVAVLQNRGSASAAEIVAGALQDMDRAVVMGERSFGKGLVQSSRTLPYNSVIKFTSAKYYIPSGRCIQAIDYAHRNEDGSVGRIPDSLTHVFHTAAGREVRDGGGIKPDVELAPQTMSNVLFMAVSRNVIFDYATRYRQQHDAAPASLADLHLADEDYADFCRQLRANVTDSVMRRYQVLDLDRDLDSLKAEVVGGIEQALALRYYHQHGQIEKMLEGDTLVHRAAALLADPKRYAALLSAPDPEPRVKKKK